MSKNLHIAQMLVPSSKYSIKCPYSMKPTGVVIHNTYNTASALNEISYMNRNNNSVSFHYAVDEKQAVQGLPLNRNGWHAGDGQGKGNRERIAIEICRSRSDKALFLKAEDNGAFLAAKILVQYGWGMGQLTKHQDYSGKRCPHRTLDLGWQRFVKLVQTYYNQLKSGGTSTPPTPSPNTGNSGSKNQIVRTTGNLQKHLNILGFKDDSDNLLVEDGNYGTKTKEAVKSFEKAYGLPVDGIADNGVWNMLDFVFQEGGLEVRVDKTAVISIAKDEDRTVLQPLINLLAGKNSHITLITMSGEFNYAPYRSAKWLIAVGSSRSAHSGYMKFYVPGEKEELKKNLEDFIKNPNKYKI